MRHNSVIVDQPTWRLWGEESVPGAIYTVYLKKVRYFSPKMSIYNSNKIMDDDMAMVASMENGGDVDGNVDDISHLEWETVRVRFIKAGTPEMLVASLSSEEGELESSFVSVLLSTYRSFATTKQLLDLILQRYKDCLAKKENVTACSEDTEGHCKSLRQGLHMWLDQFSEDFMDPPMFLCLVDLETFCQEYLPGSEMDEKVRRVGNELRRRSEDSGRLSSSYAICEPNLESLKIESSPSYLELTDIPDTLFANQLTRMDNILFQRVIPYQCLGCAWSKRDRSSRDGQPHSAPSVAATVDQFNAVLSRVISTILVSNSADYTKYSVRAKNITKWIDVAQELRVLKSFSSLKAIITGLQSTSVHRLKKTWSYVSKIKIEVFKELARIFSEDNNAIAQRELLNKEGTARFANTTGENDHRLQRVLQKQSENSKALSYGTIPYLGTFLTDLTMLDAAIPDVIANDLINFDKKRKEFQILAQIKLLQGAANAYKIERNEKFENWFLSFKPLLSEREAYDISCKIEPLPMSASNHNKSDSIASIGSSSSGSQALCDSEVYSHLVSHSQSGSSQILDSIPSNGVGVVSSTPRSPSSNSSFQSLCTSEDLTCPMLNQATSGIRREVHTSRKAASLGNCSNSLLSINTRTRNSTSNTKTSLPSISDQNKITATDGGGGGGFQSPFRTADFYIIRVTVETFTAETEGLIMYKSIMISNYERTSSVIRSAMVKHGLEGSTENYTLSQYLPNGKEFLIPDNTNVYYAINIQHDLNFVLRQKPDFDDEVRVAVAPTSSRLHHHQDEVSNPRWHKYIESSTNKVKKKILNLTS